MNLNAPTHIAFLISVIFAIIGILAMVGVVIPVIGAYAGWALLVAYAILLASVILKNF
jgi:hypothetical protein